MSYISKDGIRWYRDVQQQDFGEAEHERTVNGPSRGWTRGKGCFPTKFSPIAVTIMGCRVMGVILRVSQPPVKGTPCKSWYCRSAILAERPGTSKRGIFPMLWKPQPFQIDMETRAWASLQELMLHLCLHKASLNKEVQLPALSVQHFAYFKHNDRWCFELVAK